MSRPVLKGMELWAIVATAVAAVGSLYWESTRITLGVISGGLIMTGNLLVIRRVVTDVLGETASGADEARRGFRKKWIIVQYVLKMIALFAILAGLIKFGGISPLGLCLRWVSGPPLLKGTVNY
jgi:uncharacterized membrane protein YoaK (UPF0700 family)